MFQLIIHHILNHAHHGHLGLPILGHRRSPVAALRSVYIQQKSAFNGLLIASTQRRPVPRERLSAVQADGVTPYEGQASARLRVAKDVVVNQRMATSVVGRGSTCG